MGRQEEAARRYLKGGTGNGVQVLSGTDPFSIVDILQKESIEFTAGVVAAVKQVETIAVTGGVAAAVAQVETITCTAGESTGAGDITMTITSAALTAPKAVVVPIAASAGVNDVGLALRTALAADADVAAAFTVSGADASAILTAKVAAVNDATLAFGFVDTDTTGVTFGASANTTAGSNVSGDITITVTAANMGNTPKGVVVAVLAGDSISDVATKIRVALAADADVGAFFTIGGTVGSIVLTAAAAAANDATMALALTDTDTTGVTVGASANTTAGVADVSGTITVTVTAANMDNSPAAIAVEVAEGDTVTEVAVKVLAALIDDADVGQFVTLSNVAGVLYMEVVTAAANDATFAFSFADTDTTGVTVGASTNVTAGLPKADDSYEDGDEWVKIVCIGATNFATLTPSDGFNVVGTITGIAFPAGYTIEGRFVYVDLTSGSALAYKA